MIFLQIMLHSAVHIYDFHIFIISSSSFRGFITSQFNDLLPVGFLPQLVERCTGITEVKGSNPVQAWILFRVSFRNCKSCVYNCDDLSSNNSSLCSSHIWFSHIHNFRGETVTLTYLFSVYNWHFTPFFSIFSRSDLRPSALPLGCIKIRTQGTYLPS